MYTCNMCIMCIVTKLPFRVAECRFFDSKMRPLLLVFKNPDTSAEHKDVRIIFKNGDGRCDLQSVHMCHLVYSRPASGHAYTSDHQYYG